MTRCLWGYVGVLFLLLLVGLGAPAEDCTITVKPGESIQEAIDAAPEGAVICLAAGDWEEHLLIEKSLTLHGAEEGTTIRMSKEGVPIVYLRTPGEDEGEVVVVLVALTLTGGRGWSGTGVEIAGFAQVTIEGATITENHCGVRMWGSSRAVVTDSTIGENESTGIWVRDSAQVTVLGSTIEGNKHTGIYMEFSPQATIVGSAIEGNGGTGVWMLGFARATIVDSIIRGNASSGIILSFSSQAVIQGSTIAANVFDGLRMRGSAEAMVEETTLEGNIGCGICLFEQPCYFAHEVFSGYVIGKGNAGGGNSRGDYCPVDLGFLFTEEGGELDRRK